MKHLVIIGARGWGREIFNMLPDFIGYQTEFDVKGFLDDKKDALEGTPGYPPILDSVEHYKPEADDVFTCALGDAYWKKHYSEIIKTKKGKFINLISKLASIGKNTKIGDGCIIAGNAGLSCDIIVGDFVTIQPHAIIGHDVQIGDFSHLGCRSFMGGFVVIGYETTINTGSIILPHVKVGNNCVVGAGSVVIKKVKDGDTVFGNPAKKLDF